MVAGRIKVERSGKAEAANAELFLSSCTVKRRLCAAMLADAADEGLILTRLFDAEEQDPGHVHQELQVFVHRIRTLFLERKALECGFTKI
eukprot:3754332-Pyramimonas_sp.AAC.1